MFAVDIEMDNKIKTYYVWGKGELIEVKAIEPDGYMSIDESLSLDVCIKTIRDAIGYRYLSETQLQTIVSFYNDTYHESIKMTPKTMQFKKFMMPSLTFDLKSLCSR